MSLIRIIYISRTALDATETSRELPSILAASRANNPRCGVTGALLVSRKGFAQVLEGPSAAVSETFERIQWDLRHDDVTVLSVEAVPERQFGEWAMACCDGAEVLSDAGITLAKLADRGADAAQPTLALLHGAMAAQDRRSRYMIAAEVQEVT